jgi:AraC-like DNA-binding protein
MARPKAKIDPDQIREMALIGCSAPRIAQILGCSLRTIHRRFGDVYRQAKFEGQNQLRRKQHERALAGSDRMLIHLGKHRLGQRDRVEVTGQRGRALAVTTTEVGPLDPTNGLKILEQLGYVRAVAPAPASNGIPAE